MFKERVLKFFIGSHFLPAIINDDRSGLTCEDDNFLDAWVEKWGIKGNYTIEVDKTPDFRQCEITNLGSECYTIYITFWR